MFYFTATFGRQSEIENWLDLIQSRIYHQLETGYPAIEASVYSRNLTLLCDHAAYMDCDRGVVLTVAKTPSSYSEKALRYTLFTAVGPSSVCLRFTTGSSAEVRSFH